jgi:AcrR family transcriptional regulator
MFKKVELVTKSDVTSSKSEETRHSILSTALKLFRSKGFDSTTMRDIARESGMSLGAAYYYFPTKEAIVMAYYRDVQDEHSRRMREQLAHEPRLRERVGAIIHSKLDILGADRKLLGALLRFTGQPDHPLSFLGLATRQLRDESIELFTLAISNERLAEDMRKLLAISLWSLHMGIMLYFLYDDSKRQERTRCLVDHSLDLTLHLIGIAKFPLLKPVRTRVLTILSEAGLMPPMEGLIYE